MRIVLFGSGNLATQLGLALHSVNVEITQIFGRTERSVSQLAGLLGCSWTMSKKEILTDADLYIVAVSDDALGEVLSGIPLANRLVVHTSGSLPMDVLSSFTSEYGVFYPLQTFSAGRDIDFREIPVCLEASSGDNLEKLRQLASTLSDKVVSIHSDDRRQLHLAAVFVCNFANHFFGIGETLLEERNLDFSLLKPLILETARKGVSLSPLAAQTGPAVRNNKAIMEKHLAMLEGHPEWQELYQLISKNITDTHK